ncbi:MAG: hypothetical protein G01um101416_312 [Microgenomates group bacterium Gr01-1014_16]|nr:MAG: hypothetical protein G01um101416_312 [Microgenomates group bacterium Gr01-1014_16]
MAKSKTDKLISQIYLDPRYRGKHIIIMGGKIHATRSGMGSHKHLMRLIKQFPQETPVLTYIPKADTLILLLK